MYVGEQKYFNHDLGAVDIPFIEMILHKKLFPLFTDFYFIKLRIFLTVYLTPFLVILPQCNRALTVSFTSSNDIESSSENLTLRIQAEIPFTNNTHEPVAFVRWEESITHNAERTRHSALAIVAKEMLLQS